MHECCYFSKSLKNLTRSAKISGGLNDMTCLPGLQRGLVNVVKPKCY